MGYRWCGREFNGVPQEFLPGVPSHDLTNDDVRQLADDRGWTLEETRELLDKAKCFERVADAKLPPPPGPTASDLSTHAPSEEETAAAIAAVAARTHQD